jgi:hypothetical protein
MNAPFLPPRIDLGLDGGARLARFAQPAHLTPAAVRSQQ